MDIDEVLTRDAIRRTLARYTLCGDRGRMEELVACFAPDGVLEFEHEWKAQGREQILRQAAEAADVPIAPEPEERDGGWLPHLERALWAAVAALVVAAGFWAALQNENSPTEAEAFSKMLEEVKEKQRQEREEREKRQKERGGMPRPGD